MDKLNNHIKLIWYNTSDLKNEKKKKQDDES